MEEDIHEFLDELNVVKKKRRKKEKGGCLAS